jgi:hypothetical protein
MLLFALSGAGDLNVPIQFENVRFNQPHDAYVSLHILAGSSKQTELKESAVVRHPGVIQIDCLVSEDTTSTLLNRLVDFVGKVFERKSFMLPDGARVICRTADDKYLGQLEGWARNSVSISFYRDEAPALPGQ